MILVMPVDRTYQSVYQYFGYIVHMHLVSSSPNIAVSMHAQIYVLLIFDMYFSLHIVFLWVIIRILGICMICMCINMHCLCLTAQDDCSCGAFPNSKGCMQLTNSKMTTDAQNQDGNKHCEQQRATSGNHGGWS